MLVSPFVATRLMALQPGAPALLYEVVSTREVVLLAGSRIQAISFVLAVFFGGLATCPHGECERFG